MPEPIDPNRTPIWRQVALAVATVLVVAGVLTQAGLIFTTNATKVAAFAVAFIGLNLLTHHLGLLSLGQGAMLGIGAVAGLHAVRDFGLPPTHIPVAGRLAGVSSHCPDNIKRVADEGWENDFFMTCFHYVTRPSDQQKELMGRTTVGEPFLESDPDDMTAVARAVEKPCLGFKILAAGRKCWSKYAVEKAFKYAFANLKPIDAVIVGIFPKYYDEVAEDAKFARKYGAIG